MSAVSICVCSRVDGFFLAPETRSVSVVAKGPHSSCIFSPSLRHTTAPCIGDRCTHLFAIQPYRDRDGITCCLLSPSSHTFFFLPLLPLAWGSVQPSKLQGSQKLCALDGL